MLSGIYFPDEGQIYVHDKPVTIASPKDAFDLGIGMIHQMCIRDRYRDEDFSIFPPGVRVR